MSTPPSQLPSHSPAGLLLTGGGARAAYQVGVLQAISELRRKYRPNEKGNPFPIIAGTSAGAINAAALACGADDFHTAVRRIALVWSNFKVNHIYYADTWGLVKNGARWVGMFSLGWAVPRWRRIRPRSLLDNAPLAALIKKMVPLERLPELLAQGHIQALAVTASSYSTGHHVTFFDGAPHLQPWVRSQRMAARGPITHAHLLASSAIPFIFPAQSLTVNGSVEYFGDGSMRQTAPVAPAIHLGAERILVIGAGRMVEPQDASGEGSSTGAAYPSMAQIAGHAMSSIFLDALAVDVERIRRINKTLSLIPPEARQSNTALRPVELLVISPSQRVDEIAARHTAELPAMVRSLLGGLGVSVTGRNGNGTGDSGYGSNRPGGALASYLLFESGFTRELMALGRADALRQEDEIRAFFGWN